MLKKTSCSFWELKYTIKSVVANCEHITPSPGQYQWGPRTTCLWVESKEWWERSMGSSALDDDDDDDNHYVRKYNAIHYSQPLCVCMHALTWTIQKTILRPVIYSTRHYSTYKYYSCPQMLTFSLSASRAHAYSTHVARQKICDDETMMSIRRKRRPKDNDDDDDDELVISTTNQHKIEKFFLFKITRLSHMFSYYNTVKETWIKIWIKERAKKKIPMYVYKRL